MSLTGVIRECQKEGAKYLLYHTLFYPLPNGEEDWHWDIHREDPHVWFHIPKPWTASLYWKGFRWAIRNRKLPIRVFAETWTFTYYKGVKSGCQGRVCSDPERGLRLALAGFRCTGECADCPDRALCQEEANGQVS